MQNAMHRNNDTTYVDLFLNNKIRCPALGVIVDIAVVETQKSRNPEMNYSGKKFCSTMHGSSVWWFAVAVVAWNSVWGNLQQKQIKNDFNNVYAIK